MCIIIYSEKGNIPKKHLNGSLDNNRDGWGVMFPDGGELKIVNGLTDTEFWKEWKVIKKVAGPKVFHARIATHGTKGISNCHPFVVPNHPGLGVAHNGIISHFTKAKANDDRSDTKRFVDEILAQLPIDFYKFKVFHTLLSDFVGSGSKLAFLNRAGECYIINERLGNWISGNWYSNYGFNSWSKTCKPMGFCASDTTHYGQKFLSDCGTTTTVASAADNKITGFMSAKEYKEKIRVASEEIDRKSGDPYIDSICTGSTQALEVVDYDDQEVLTELTQEIMTSDKLTAAEKLLEMTELYDSKEAAIEAMSLWTDEDQYQKSLANYYRKEGERQGVYPCVLPAIG